MRSILLSVHACFFGFEFFYSFNVQVSGRCAASSRSVPWNEVFDPTICTDFVQAANN